MTNHQWLNVTQLDRNERRWLTFAGAIAVLCFVVAIPLILDAGFGAEDFLIAPRAQEGWGHAMLTYFGAADPEAIHYYRPACRAVQRTLQVFYDTSPAVFHTWNLILHLFAVWLVYRLARSLSGDKAIAVLAGLVFLIHPAHDEPIIWVSGISALTETVWHLLGLLAFDRFLRTRDRLTGGAVIVCFAFGVLSKESGVSILLTMPLLWWYRGHEKRALWPYAGVAAATAALFAWRKIIGVDSSLPLLNLTPNPLAWGRNAVYYLVQFLVPVRSVFRLIGFDNYYRLRDMLPPVPTTMLYGAGIIVALGLIAWILLRTWGRFPRLAILAVLLAIAAIGPLFISRYPGLRLMYLSSGMLAIAVAAIVMQSARRKWFVAVVSVWIVIMSLSLVERAEAWRESGHLAGRIFDAALYTCNKVPDEATVVFRGIPGRYLGGYVFPVTFSEAVSKRVPPRYRLTIINYDDPHEYIDAIPGDARWYQWDGEHFLPSTAPAR